MGRKSSKNTQFSFSGQKKAVLYKIVLWGILGFLQTVERLAYFEMQPDSELSEEFSGTVCTLYSWKLRFEKEIYAFVKFIISYM